MNWRCAAFKAGVGDICVNSRREGKTKKHIRLTRYVSKNSVVAKNMLAMTGAEAYSAPPLRTSRSLRARLSEEGSLSYA
jgi:hypothetical protein